MKKQVLTVTELNKLVKEMLEMPEIFQHLCVQGEVSNLTFHRSGHIYFSIKDENAVMRCLIWRDDALRLKNIKLHEGLQVICQGRLSYYVAGGMVSFEVREMALKGQGELQKLYETRYQTLVAQGWTAAELKKNLPEFPQNIGIITADTGAAIHDFLITIQRRYPLATVYFFPAQVQGTLAPEDLAKKIKQASDFVPQLDVLVLARGGGSYEDLWTFNELIVLEAVYHSPIPIVSAIGHETDITLVDFISDQRAATATAAAELITPQTGALQRDLNAVAQALINEMTLYLNAKETWLTKTSNLWAAFLNQVLTLNLQNLQNFYQRWQEKMFLQIALETNALNNLTLQWQLSNPLQPLEKGYVLIMNQAQKIINNISTLKIGEKINLQAQQGIIEAQVRRVILKKEGN